MGGEHNGEFSGVPVGEKDFVPAGVEITLGVRLIIDDAISLGTNGELSLVCIFQLLLHSLDVAIVFGSFNL
jgi:hypothetical protein